MSVAGCSSARADAGCSCGGFYIYCKNRVLLIYYSTFLVLPLHRLAGPPISESGAARGMRTCARPRWPVKVVELPQCTPSICTPCSAMPSREGPAPRPAPLISCRISSWSRRHVAAAGARVSRASRYRRVRRELKQAQPCCQGLIGARRGWSPVRARPGGKVRIPLPDASADCDTMRLGPPAGDMRLGAT